APELAGLVKVTLKVIYLYVDGDIIVGFVAETIDVPLNAAGLCRRDHPRRAGGVNLPIEHLRAEFLSLCRIPAPDFEMHHGLAHACSFVATSFEGSMLQRSGRLSHTGMRAARKRINRGH